MPMLKVELVALPQPQKLFPDDAHEGLAHQPVKVRLLEASPCKQVDVFFGCVNLTKTSSVLRREWGRVAHL